MNPKSKSSRKIRYAVVGLGHIAQVAVLPGFKTARNSQLVALVSDDEQKRQKLGKKYKVEETYSYSEYARALSTVDAVYLTIPNHLHRDFTIQAAKAGVHVLCEKPMAVTSKDCEAMMKAADQNDVNLMIAYRLHFEKGNLEAIRLAENGKLGELRIFSSEFAQDVAAGNVRLQPVEKGGGPVYDMGVYCINAARYLFRAEPESVLASSASRKDKRFEESEEMTSVVMRFPGERLASFTASFGAADIGRFVLIGTKGTLALDPAYEYAMPIEHHLTIGDKTSSRKFPKRDQFAAEVQYFSDCILKNRKPEPSGTEGLADVRIVEAIYKSARSGREVKLGAFPDKRRPTMRQEITKPAHGKPKVVHAESPSGEAA